MNRLLVLLLALFALMPSCKSGNQEVRRQKVNAVELDAMMAIGGREHVTTIGTQAEVGPYEVWSGLSGGRGTSTTFDGLPYKFPDDDRVYCVWKFRNPDGTPFMRVSRFPEGAGKVKTANKPEEATPNPPSD